MSHPNTSTHDYWRVAAPERLYPSVTTIIDAAFGKPNLVPHARRHAIEYLLARATEIGAAYPTASQIEAQVTRDSLREADLGTRVHEAIEKWIKSRDDLILRDIERHMDGFMDFERRMGARWLASEVMFVSEPFRYGGAADALGYFNDAPDELTAVDFKTGKWTWLEHLLQLAGYVHGLGAYEGVPIKRAAIVQVREAGTWWKPVPMAEIERAIPVFLRCVENYEWLASMKGFEA